MNSVLLSLSDNDKRLIFAVLLVLIILIALVGLLGYLLLRLMKWQAKKMDTLVHDAVKAKLITNRKAFIKYGRVKNWAYFFKQAYIPILILILGFIILVIHNSIYKDWSYNPFSTYDGFGTIFFTWKLSGEYTDGVFIKFAKLALDNTPHLTSIAWAGYIIGPCTIIGGTWYLVSVSCLLSRTVKLYRRAREIFEKSLDGYRQSEDLNSANNSSSENN